MQKKIKVLRELFNDIKYRASQKGFEIETHFEPKVSAIQVKRIVDNTIVYRLVDEIENEDKRFAHTEMLKSQIKTFEHFISYMSFYGIFTVAFSYDEEQKELKEKEEKEKEKIKDA
jgi:hypothetical protein